MGFWERERNLDTVAIRPTIVKIAGDLAAGAVLCQILYWFRPKKGEPSKVKVFRHGKYWIAKPREIWCEECSITLKQYRRVMPSLVEKGIIEYRIMKFGGNTWPHVSLNVDVLDGLLTEFEALGIQANVEVVGAVNTVSKNIAVPKGPIPSVDFHVNP